MKKKMFIVLFIAGITSVASAQQPDNHSPFSIEINTGLYSKIRGKIEYRFKKDNAFQLGVSKCYGAANPGIQAYLEYRKYFNKQNSTELFLYGKVGAGQSYTFGGNYGLFGLGFGQKIGLGKKKSFFVQFSEGLKACPIISGDVEGPHGLGGLFYIIGPGAIVDLNINLGYRF